MSLKTNRNIDTKMGLKTRNNRANQSSSKQFDHRLQEGLALHKQGYLEQAQSIYEEIIRLSPHHFDALQLLGTIAGQKSEWQRAASFISKALKINPLHPVAWNNLGNVKNELKQYKEALACYDKAIALDLVYADAHYNRGNVLKELHQLPESLDSYKKAIALQSTESEFFYNQGIVLQDLKRFEEALQSFDQAIALNPSFSKAHNNRGAVLSELERFDEALTTIERAIELDRNYAEAHNNLGTVLVNLMRVDEAIKSFDLALHLNPNFAEALNNRSSALLATGKIDEALEETNKALQINPDLPVAHWNQSLCHLLKGNFSDGWKGYGWRFRLHSAIGKYREFLQPLWLGNFTIENKTILLHAEQGLGDTIQFCRYVDLVYERGARIILEVQKPLIDLMKKLPGGISLISDGDQLPDFDCHCPLLSLPLAFKTDLKSIPRPSGHISVDPIKLEYWSKRLGTKTKPRIGLVWSGNIKHKGDRSRSLPLAKLIERIPPNYEVISLQKEIRDSDYNVLVNSNLQHFGQELNDFSDTAALCELMDLIISVDTSVAHLAASLDKPTWILISFAPDWRWLLDREDSPWYPSVKLYRQSTLNDWSNVLTRLNTDLVSQCVKLSDQN